MVSLILQETPAEHCPSPPLDSSDSHEAVLEVCPAPTKNYPCPTCRQCFTKKASRKAHQRENMHAYCNNCNAIFLKEGRYRLHMKFHHPDQAITILVATEFRCCDCELDFTDEGALEDHLRTDVHGLKKEDAEKKWMERMERKERKKKKKEMNKEGEEKKKKERIERRKEKEEKKKQEKKRRKEEEKKKVKDTKRERQEKEKKGKKQEQPEEGNQQLKCEKCERTFKNQHAVEQHLKSVRHNPLSNIKCVADAKCKKRFNCPSAQLRHLESGACVSGMTKTKLNAAIAANDTEQIITLGGGMAQWQKEEDSSATSTSQMRSPILTPTSTSFSDSYPPSGILTPTSTLSTNENFHSMLTLQLRNQNGYQKCQLCPPSHTRTFKPSGLQDHLSSSVHAQVSKSLPLPVIDEISFRCPSALMVEGSGEKPIKQFLTLSGLAQHLESGACNGGKATFRRVVEYVQEEMKALGFGGLKMLG